jgi:hypothetical protein
MPSLASDCVCALRIRSATNDPANWGIVESSGQLFVWGRAAGLEFGTGAELTIDASGKLRTGE